MEHITPEAAAHNMDDLFGPVVCGVDMYLIMLTNGPISPRRYVYHVLWGSISWVRLRTSVRDDGKRGSRVHWLAGDIVLITHSVHWRWMKILSLSLREWISYAAVYATFHVPAPFNVWLKKKSLLTGSNPSRICQFARFYSALRSRCLGLFAWIHSSTHWRYYSLQLSTCSYKSK